MPSRRVFVRANIWKAIELAEQRRWAEGRGTSDNTPFSRLKPVDDEPIQPETNVRMRRAAVFTCYNCFTNKLGPRSSRRGLHNARQSALDQQKWREKVKDTETGLRSNFLGFGCWSTVNRRTRVRLHRRPTRLRLNAFLRFYSASPRSTFTSTRSSISKFKCQLNAIALATGASIQRN